MADFFSGSSLDAREGHLKIDVLENMWCLFLLARCSLCPMCDRNRNTNEEAGWHPSLTHLEM